MTQSNTGGSPIRRYTLVRGGIDHLDVMCVRPDGKWIRHEDHTAEVLEGRAREAEMRAEIKRLRAIVGKGPTHRHIKRGTLYRHLGTARVQSDEPLTDDAEVEVYHGAHGDLWARRKSEFHDGRFAALSQPDSGEGAEHG